MVQERYLKGYEFQEHLKTLLSLSGYFEGQIYSTGIPGGETDHLAKLKKAGKKAYTSPDILIANKWMEETPSVEFRFGLSCSRRDKLFDNYGEISVTLLTYQRKSLEEMKKTKKLEIYLVFGKKLNENFAIGVTVLREPDFVRHYTDASTGSERWNYIYYVRNLKKWEDFIRERIGLGDREPSLENLYGTEIPWLGAVI